MVPTAVPVNELGPVNSGGRMIGGPKPGIVDVRVGVEKVDGSGILPQLLNTSSRASHFLLSSSSMR